MVDIVVTTRDVVLATKTRFPRGPIIFLGTLLRAGGGFQLLFITLRDSREDILCTVKYEYAHRILTSCIFYVSLLVWSLFSFAVVTAGNYFFTDPRREYVMPAPIEEEVVFEDRYFLEL